MRKEKLDEIEKLNFPDEKSKVIFTVCCEVEELPHDDLLRIDNELSLYNWPDDLPGKPDWWNKMSFSEKNEWIGSIRRHIETEVSRKAILRYHHINNLGRTAEQFNDWWDSKILSTLEDNNKELRKGYYRHDNRDDRGYTCVKIITSTLLFCLGFLAAVVLFRLKG